MSQFRFRHIEYHRYILLICCILKWSATTYAQDTIILQKTEDFIVDGYGSNPTWNQTDWISLSLQSSSDVTHRTMAKVMYSNIGIYYLINSEDHQITASFTRDYSDLWTEDVIEIFLWPDTTQSIYFEYELSPKNIELPLIIPNMKGNFFGWRPWKYVGDRKIVHETSVQMQANDQGASISGWTAEFFIPFKLLDPMVTKAPAIGDVWRGNLYRMDYDTGERVRWAWQKTTSHFHEFDRFGYLLFN